VYTAPAFRSYPSARSSPGAFRKRRDSERGTDRGDVGSSVISHGIVSRTRSSRRAFFASADILDRRHGFRIPRRSLDGHGSGPLPPSLPDTVLSIVLTNLLWMHQCLRDDTIIAGSSTFQNYSGYFRLSYGAIRLRWRRIRVYSFRREEQSYWNRRKRLEITSNRSCVYVTSMINAYGWPLVLAYARRYDERRKANVLSV